MSCTPNLLIGTGYPHLMPWTSIGMTAEQHMLSVLNRSLVLQTSPAILRPSVTMPLLSIPSHILKGPVSLPINFFALRLGSSEHDELQDSQYKVGTNIMAYIPAWFLALIQMSSHRFPKSRKVEYLKIQECSASEQPCLLSHLPLREVGMCLNVCSSALSRTIASRARLYTLEYCEIQLEILSMTACDWV